MSAADGAAVAEAPAAEPAVTVPDNILLADWTGPYDGVPPWDKVTPELFPQAIQFGIDEQRREVLAIADSPEAPTFANTVEALEKVGASGLFAIASTSRRCSSIPNWIASGKSSGFTRSQGGTPS